MAEENFLTAKLGPAPAWVWVGGVGIVVGGVWWWRKRQAANAAASSQYGAAVGTAGPTPLASTEELLAAGQYQPPNISYNIGPAGSGPSPSPTPSPNPLTAPTVGGFIGSGYGPPTGSSIISTPSGNYEYLGNWSQVTALQAAGAPLFTQPEPGVFVPWTGPTSANPGTPLFAQTPYNALAAAPPPQQPLAPGGSSITSPSMYIPSVSIGSGG